MGCGGSRSDPPHFVEFDLTCFAARSITGANGDVVPPVAWGGRNRVVAGRDASLRRDGGPDFCSGAPGNPGASLISAIESEFQTSNRGRCLVRRPTRRAPPRARAPLRPDAIAQRRSSLDLRDPVDLADRLPDRSAAPETARWGIGRRAWHRGAWLRERLRTDRRCGDPGRARSWRSDRPASASRTAHEIKRELECAVTGVSRELRLRRDGRHGRSGRLPLPERSRHCPIGPVITRPGRRLFARCPEPKGLSSYVRSGRSGRSGRWVVSSRSVAARSAAQWGRAGTGCARGGFAGAHPKRRTR